MFRISPMLRTANFIAVAFLCLFAAAASLPAQDRPELVVSDNGWDFGKRDQGAKDEKTIRLENRGKAPLVIRRVGVTCGCVKVAMKPQTLAPGAAVDLVMKLDLTNQTGYISKHVIIDSNDFKRPRLLLPVRGESRPIWWTKPTSINLGQVRHGEKQVTSFRVYVRPGLDLPIDKVISSHDKMTFKVTPFGETKGDHGHMVQVVLDPSIRPGPFRGHIAIHIKNKVKHLATVSVYADVAGDVELSVKRVNFGGVSKGASVTRIVDVIKMRGADDLKVEGIAFSDKRIRVTKEEVEKGRRVRLTITFTSDGAPRRFGGRLQIRTNDPLMPTIPLPYQGAVRP